MALVARGLRVRLIDAGPRSAALTAWLIACFSEGSRRGPSSSAGWAYSARAGPAARAAAR